MSRRAWRRHGGGRGRDGLARLMRPVWGEVLVAEEDMARARELLDAFLATDAGEPGKDE